MNSKSFVVVILLAVSSVAQAGAPAIVAVGLAAPVAVAGTMYAGANAAHIDNAVQRVVSPEAFGAFGQFVSKSNYSIAAARNGILPVELPVELPVGKVETFKNAVSSYAATVKNAVVKHPVIAGAVAVAAVVTAVAVYNYVQAQKAEQEALILQAEAEERAF